MRRLTRFLAAAASAATAVVLAASGPIPTASAASAGDFSISAHRGGASWATENTLAAFSAGDNRGATAIETDIRITSDGQFVLMHDGSLDRTTTCSGPISSRTLADIQANCFGKKNHERIPSAGEALAWAKSRNMNMLMEVKADPQWGESKVLDLTSLIRAYGYADRVSLTSVSEVLLLRIERVDPGMRTRLITCRGWKADHIDPNVDGVNMCAKIVNDSRVQRLRNHGHLVMGRTSDRVEEWRTYRAAGIRAIVTDRVRDLRAFMR